jgi:hypothetical protein
MAVRGWILGTAASLLWLLAGCTPNAVWESYFEARLVGGETLAGSPSSVSFLMHSTLSNLGLFATIRNDGETIRIDSRTHSGKKFYLLLTRDGSAEGQRTLVRVKWEDEADNMFWLDLLTAVRNPAPPGPPPPNSAIPSAEAPNPFNPVPPPPSPPSPFSPAPLPTQRNP